METEIQSAILLITETQTEFPACLYNLDSAMFIGNLKVAGKPCVVKHSLGVIFLILPSSVWIRHTLCSPSPFDLLLKLAQLHFYFFLHIFYAIDKLLGFLGSSCSSAFFKKCSRNVLPISVAINWMTFMTTEFPRCLFQ